MCMKEMAEEQIKEMVEELTSALEDGVKASIELEEAFQRTYGVLAQELKFECAKKLIDYADKYSNATFLTRWYWKRKLRLFVKGIDVLKEL